MFRPCFKASLDTQNTITIGDHVILQPIYKMEKDTSCLFDLYRLAFLLLQTYLDLLPFLYKPTSQ